MSQSITRRRSFLVAVVILAGYYAVFETRENTLPLPDMQDAYLIYDDDDMYFSEKSSRPQLQESFKDSIQRLKRERTKQRIIHVHHNDNLYSLLQENHIDRETTDRIIDRLRPAFHPSGLRVGDGISITYALDDNGTILYPHLIELATAEKLRVGVARMKNGDYFAYKRANSTTADRYRAEGQIRTTFSKSLHERKVPQKIVLEAIKVLSYDIDFQRDIEKGDSFQIAYEIIRERETNNVITMRLLLAKLETQTQALNVYRFEKQEDDGFLPFYHANGTSVVRALLKTPLSGSYISSAFGVRQDPISGYTRLHRGIDFAAPISTPILAAGDGVVTEAGTRQYYGNYIKIKHNSVYSTVYAHLNATALNMFNGATVKQGDVIGYVGSTGRSTGPHLHYEVHRHDGKINPMLLSFPASAQLKGQQLRQFKRHVIDYNLQYSTLPMTTQLARGGDEQQEE